MLSCQQGRRQSLLVSQALSEALSHKVMREARAQQEELDAEDQPEGAIAQVMCCDNAMTGKSDCEHGPNPTSFVEALDLLLEGC